MKTRVQKWGNSLAVRLPKAFAEGLDLGDGSPAEMTLEDGAIVVKPDPDRVCDLATLLAGVTDDNVHSSWETEAADSGGSGDEDERPGGSVGR